MGYAWSEIEYTVCCDGTTKAKFRGSVIPSYYGYLDGQNIANYSWATNAQKNFDSFRCGGESADREAPAHD